jgi:hypothetical protein
MNCDVKKCYQFDENEDNNCAHPNPLINGPEDAAVCLRAQKDAVAQRPAALIGSEACNLKRRNYFGRNYLRHG